LDGKNLSFIHGTGSFYETKAHDIVGWAGSSHYKAHTNLLLLLNEVLPGLLAEPSPTLVFPTPQ
jgi:hypothetical protein